MKRRGSRRVSATGALATSDPFIRGIRAVLGSTVIVLPLFIARGEDWFRLPKDLFLRTSVIVMVALLCGRIIWTPSTAARIARLTESRWVAIIIGWTALSATLAVNRMASIQGLANVVIAAFFFLCTFIALQGAPWQMLALVLIPAIVNSVLALEQALLRAAPFPLSPVLATGMLGNGNDLGSYLIAPLLASLAIGVATRRPLRIAFLGCAVVLAAGLIVSKTVTGIASACVGALTLLIIAHRRRGLLMAVVTLVAGMSAFLVYRPLTQRAVDSISWFRNGDYDRLLTFRLTPFLAAWNMAREHPLFGVGPAGFAPNYFDWKVKLEQRFPRLLHHPFAEQQSFGETHNDHLQTMAEAGLPGYALFLLTLWMIGRVSFDRSAREDSTTEGRVAGLLAFPLALSFAVLTLAQFPTRLAAPLSVYLYCAAACRAWVGPLKAGSASLSTER